MASLRQFIPLVRVQSFQKIDGKVGISCQFLRCISTSNILMKKTPHTVGTMSWVRAARRRKYLEQQMKDFEKSDHQIIREEQLARIEPEIKFRLPAREVATIDENIMHQLHIKPEIFLSLDKKTIVCYHPPPKDYPESYTKPAVGRSLFGMDQNLLNTFRDTITAEEISEGMTLREKDPRLWNTDALVKLFKIKPEVVRANIPISRKQKQAAIAERELYDSMSVLKRRKVRDLQNWERIRYIRSTRGKKYAQFFKSISEKGKPKITAPSKF